MGLKIRVGIRWIRKATTLEFAYKKYRHIIDILKHSMLSIFVRKKFPNLAKCDVRFEICLTVDRYDASFQLHKDVASIEFLDIPLKKKNTVTHETYELLGIQEMWKRAWRNPS